MATMTKKLAQGGFNGNPIYQDIQVLETYKNLCLGKHPDGQAGIFEIQTNAPNYLMPSKINFGETLGTNQQPGQEIKVTSEPEARQKWDQLVEKWQAREAEEAAQQAATLAMQKQRESNAQIRSMKIKKIIAAKNSAIDGLRQHIQTPGIDLFSKKVTDLADQVQRCETILKHI